MPKIVMVRLPEEAAKKIQREVEHTGIPFATLCKSYILEKINAGTAEE